MVWLKGNLHTHSTASDGDVSPIEVVRWYASHGYDFLVLSDHNLRVPVEPLADELRSEGGEMLLIPGEEVTTWWPDGRRTLALHVGAIDAHATLGPGSGGSVIDVLEDSLRRVRSAGGLAILNHPNFWESVTAEEVQALSGLTHLEIFNGHPLTHSLGTDHLPAVEAIWDRVLCSGRRVWGVAVDDAHDFISFGPQLRNPGRGWVVVEATARSAAAVMAALRDGRFYSSTGPELVAVDESPQGLSVEAGTEGVIDFISEGVVVATHTGRRAWHSLPATGYLRGRFRNKAGVAWTQPVFR